MERMTEHGIEEPLEKWHGVIFLTKGCNLDCLHCDWHEKPDQAEHMDIETLEEIRSYGPRKLNFLGGEPLLYDHLEEAFDIFSGIPITVQTNGLLVKENIDLLKRARGVIVSVEGNKETTDYIRANDRDFSVYDRVMEAVELLVEEDIDVWLRASVWRDNLRQMPGLLEKAKELGVGFFVFPQLNEPPVSSQEQMWLFQQFAEYENAHVDQPHFFSCLGKGGFCAAGERRLGFDVNGRIMPCQWWDSYYLGEVGDDFERIQKSAETFVKTYKQIPSACQGCKWAEKCGGSCFLTDWYTSCPERPRVKKMLPSQGDYGGTEKASTVKKELAGVVTC